MKHILRRLLSKPKKSHRDLVAIASAVECDEWRKISAGTVALDVQNRAGRVRINHAISKAVADDLIDELDRLAGVKNLTVTISAPIGLGGESLRIHHKLRQVSRSGVRVECIASGDCSGAGTLVFLAGDDRHLEPGAVVAFEYPVAFGHGAARDISAAADRLEAVETAWIDAIHARTGISPVDVIAMMIKASPIAADEAVKLKIATRAPVTARHSPAIAGAILGFRPPPEPTNQQTDKPTMTAKPTAPTTSMAENIGPLHAQMDALPPAAQSVFYRKHRAELRQEMVLAAEQAALLAKLKPSIVLKKRNP